MKIMTCNIRCSTGGDGDNGWECRKDLFCRVVRSREPEVICCQEVRADQYADLAAAFPEFELFGVSDNATEYNPVDTILYRRDLFDRVDASAFWLSETPHVPGSSSWDSAYIRLATWVRLVEKNSGKEFAVINTHLDNIGQPARENQARIINEWSAAFEPTFPRILTGDMNCDRRNPAIERYKKAGWQSAHETVHGSDDPGFTFHKFKGTSYAGEGDGEWWPTDIGKIDWVFTLGDVRATDAEVVRDCEGDRYPSDHFFVSVELDL